MEREELLQQVTEVIEADGKQLSPSLSEESINGELDDVLGDFGDDADANQKIVARLAKRLLRMDGNIHSNVSREVREYKKKASAQSETTTEKNEGETTKVEDNDTPEWAKALLARVDAIEENRKQREATEAKDAVVNAVKKGLRAKFKEANIDVNEYVYKQTLRDLEVPEVEEGERVDTDPLVRKMEVAYYKNLKEAGLDKKGVGKSRSGAARGGGESRTRLDEMFGKKAVKEGWAKKA